MSSFLVFWSNRQVEYNVGLKFVARANLHHLSEFLAGKRTDAPHEALQILDIVLRELPNQRWMNGFCYFLHKSHLKPLFSFFTFQLSLWWRYIPVGKSFFSSSVRAPQRLGQGVESWRGFYQSIRPTQMGLSLNIGNTLLPQNSENCSISI